MEKIKFLFQQAMMISFGILVGLSIEGFVYGNDLNLKWYHPISIVLAGIVCALPTFILCSEKEMPRNKFIVRIVLHFLSLFVIVMTFGNFFKWYKEWDGALFVAGIYFFVYIFVWIVTTWLGAIEGKNINNALDGIRDEE